MDSFWEQENPLEISQKDPALVLLPAIEPGTGVIVCPGAGAVPLSRERGSGSRKR